MRIADYLMKNYYPRCPEALVPTKEQINQAILNHPEKIIIVRDKGIVGIAIFLTLSDSTYSQLERYDLRDVEVIKELCLETGNNLHFVLLTADSFKTIRLGLKRLIKNLRPKTVSWWNPEFNKLHRYAVNQLPLAFLPPTC